jgi:hypothetical protein
MNVVADSAEALSGVSANVNSNVDSNRVMAKVAQGAVDGKGNVEQVLGQVVRAVYDRRGRCVRLCGRARCRAGCVVCHVTVWRRDGTLKYCTNGLQEWDGAVRRCGGARKG